MRRHLFVLANPGAGRVRSALLEGTLRALTDAGAAVTRAAPVSAADARAAVRGAVRACAYDAVVAAGGDGTVRQAAASLIGTGMPLGVIPAGTANVLAHEIGMSYDAGRIARTLLDGPVAAVGVGRANAEPFLLMAGAGFDGRVIAALDQRLKSRLGKLAYAGPLAGALVRPPDRLAITIDNRHHEASWAVIANARHYGGRFVMAPHTGLLERGLEAILFKARSRTVLMRQLISLVLGRLDARAATGGDVEMHPCSRVTVHARHPVPTQVDGDVLGSTPLEIEALAGHLQLIVPGHSG